MTHPLYRVLYHFFVSFTGDNPFSSIREVRYSEWIEVAVIIELCSHSSSRENYLLKEQKLYEDILSQITLVYVCCSSAFSHLYIKIYLAWV